MHIYLPFSIIFYHIIIKFIHNNKGDNIKKFFKFNIYFLLLLFLFITGIYIYEYFNDSIILNKSNSYYIYDNHDNIVNFNNKSDTWITLDNIDSKLLNYVINIEDKYFYYHKGFDILRIGKSLINNIKSNSIKEGASTISQQYVKNLFLDFDKTWKRKLKEALLTIRLETHYKKDDILEGYLNTIYYGNGVYGVNNASLYYFNKDVSNLTNEEAILLALIPKNPNNYNPISNDELSKERFEIISSFLYKNNILNEDEYNNLNYDSLIIYGNNFENNSNTLMYYKDGIINELSNLNIPSSILESGSIRIFTNLDYETQVNMETSINNNMLNDDTQISSIVVEPSTGKILALSGGKNYLESQYNRALNSKRQVGSTIKPFLYYAAINSGLTSSSTFLSEKTTFVFNENKTYSPSNYADIYANKNISMSAALAYSDNIYAVKTHLFLGENTLVNTLKTCGLQESISANPSLALGSSELNMIDYATAYSTLASGGYKNDLYFIRRIEDVNGNIIYEHIDSSELVLDQSITYIINEMMSNTYNYSLVDYTSPTVLYLNGKLDRKYAIKTGTTNTDYWISGYNNDVLMMIWTGNDYNEELNTSYSRIIKDIWLETITSYEKDKENTWYTLPDNVVGIPVDPISGKYDINSNFINYFIEGSEQAYIN